MSYLIKSSILSFLFFSVLGQNAYTMDIPEVEEDRKLVFYQFSNSTNKCQLVFLNTEENSEKAHLLVLLPVSENGSVQTIHGGGLKDLDCYIPCIHQSTTCHSLQLFDKKSSVIEIDVNNEKKSTLNSSHHNNNHSPINSLFSFSCFKGIYSTFEHPFFKKAYENFKIIMKEDEKNPFTNLCGTKDIKNLILQKFLSFLPIKTIEDLPEYNESQYRRILSESEYWNIIYSLPKN